MLDFFTGFDYYDDADLTLGIFTSVVGAASVTTSAVRNGLNGLRLTTSQTVTKTGLSNASTRIIGTAIRFSSVTSGTGRCFLNLSDGDPTTPGNGQVGLMLEASGKVELRRGVGVGNTTTGTLLGTSVGALTSNVSYYLEIVATIHNSTGAATVYLDGTAIITVTGVDTQATANAYANAFGLGCMTGVNIDYDDLVCISGTGGVHTSRLGDVKVTAKIAASGNGTHQDSTPSTGTDRGAMVDDSPDPDDDSTYNTLTGVGDADSYAKASVAPAGQVYAAQTHLFVRKTDAGTCDVQGGIRIGSTDYPGTQRAVSQTYAYNTDLFENSPASSAPFTAVELSAAGSEILATRAA